MCWDLQKHIRVETSFWYFSYIHTYMHVKYKTLLGHVNNQYVIYMIYKVTCKLAIVWFWWMFEQILLPKKKFSAAIKTYHNKKQQLRANGEVSKCKLSHFYPPPHKKTGCQWRLVVILDDKYLYQYLSMAWHWNY